MNKNNGGAVNLSNEELLQAIIEFVSKEFDGVNKRIDSLEARIGNLETRMDALESRMDALESRVDALETRLDAVETKVDAMEKSIKEYVDKEVKDVMDYAIEANKEIICRLDGIDKRLDYLNYPQNSQSVFHFCSR